MFTKVRWDKSFIFNSIRLRREWLASSPPEGSRRRGRLLPLPKRRQAHQGRDSSATSPHFARRPPPGWPKSRRSRCPEATARLAGGRRRWWEACRSAGGETGAGGGGGGGGGGTPAPLARRCWA